MPKLFFKSVSGQSELSLEASRFIVVESIFFILGFSGQVMFLRALTEGLEACHSQRSHGTDATHLNRTSSVGENFELALLLATEP